MLKICYLVLICNLFEIKDNAFVSVGKYPNYTEVDINLAECGFNRVPSITDISYHISKCFKNHYPNKTIVDFEGSLSKQSSISNRVYNGPDAPYGEAPWTVYLDYRFIIAHSRSCSGVLITFEWVLTSAHCLDNISSNDYLNVHAGSNKHAGWEMRTANKKKLFQHPFYWNASNIAPGDDFKIKAFQTIGDIGLIKLENKFSRHSTDGNFYRINPICLPNPELDIKKAKRKHIGNATFYGFGIINAGGGYGENLKKGEVLLKSMDKCYMQSMLCAHFNGSEPRSCPGDSGGPLVQFVDSHRAVLIGINRGPTGNGTHCTEEMKTNTWVFVPVFIDWILKTIAEN